MKFHKELFKGSIILIIAFNLYNLLNFLFQFLMARLLSLAEYAVLSALFSFIYLSSLFSEPIQTVITKYSATEKDSSKIKNLIIRYLRKTFRVSFFIFLLFTILSIPLSNIIKIPLILLILTGFIISFSLILPVNRGILQGKKRFFSLGFNLVLESFLKIILAVIFIFLGWKIFGAIIAVILSLIFAFLFAFFSLRDIMKSTESKYETGDIFNYSLPVFISTFSITAFFSLDVLIAKIIFSDIIAGSYAIASILGKIVFFGTSPIVKTMFSFSSENHEKLKESKNILLNSLLIIIPLLVAYVFLCLFFSDFIVTFFSGRVIPEASNILFYLAIAFSLLSLTNLFILYKLSIKKTKKSWIYLTFIITQIILLFIFSANLIEFSIALIFASAIFLLYLVITLGLWSREIN